MYPTGSWTIVRTFAEADRFAERFQYQVCMRGTYKEWPADKPVPHGSIIIHTFAELSKEWDRAQELLVPGTIELRAKNPLDSQAIPEHIF